MGQCSHCPQLAVELLSQPTCYSPSPLMGAKGTNKETGGLKISYCNSINDTQNAENVNVVIAVSSRRMTVTGGIINCSPLAMSNHSNHLMP